MRKGFEELVASSLEVEAISAETICDFLTEKSEKETVFGQLFHLIEIGASPSAVIPKNNSNIFVHYNVAQGTTINLLLSLIPGTTITTKKYAIRLDIGKGSVNN